MASLKAPTSMGERAFAISLKMFVQNYSVMARSFQQFRQLRLAIAERELAQILAVQFEQISIADLSCSRECGCPKSVYQSQRPK
jgi:hypothetical protein